jgi:hypothetical protein
MEEVKSSINEFKTKGFVKIKHNKVGWNDDVCILDKKLVIHSGTFCKDYDDYVLIKLVGKDLKRIYHDNIVRIYHKKYVKESKDVEYDFNSDEE